MREITWEAQVYIRILRNYCTKMETEFIWLRMESDGWIL
jgi:hypothetical protein